MLDVLAAEHEELLRAREARTRLLDFVPRR